MAWLKEKTSGGSIAWVADGDWDLEIMWLGKHESRIKKTIEQQKTKKHWPFEKHLRDGLMEKPKKKSTCNRWFQDVKVLKDSNVLVLVDQGCPNTGEVTSKRPCLLHGRTFIGGWRVFCWPIFAGQHVRSGVLKPHFEADFSGSAHDRKVVSHFLLSISCSRTWYMSTRNSAHLELPLEVKHRSKISLHRHLYTFFLVFRDCPTRRGSMVYQWQFLFDAGVYRHSPHFPRGATDIDGQTWSVKA